MTDTLGVRMSLVERIIDLCAERYPLPVHSGEVERQAMDWGYKAETAGRRAREQADGKIWQPSGQHIEFAPTLEWLPKGKSGEYRWIPPEQRVGPERLSPSEKKVRERQEKEDKMLALAREGKLAF